MNRIITEMSTIFLFLLFSGIVVPVYSQYRYSNSSDSDLKELIIRNSNGNAEIEDEKSYTKIYLRNNTQEKIKAAVSYLDTYGVIRTDGWFWIYPGEMSDKYFQTEEDFFYLYAITSVSNTKWRDGQHWFSVNNPVIRYDFAPAHFDEEADEYIFDINIDTDLSNSANVSTVPETVNSYQQQSYEEDEERNTVKKIRKNKNFTFGTGYYDFSNKKIKGRFFSISYNGFNWSLANDLGDVAILKDEAQSKKIGDSINLFSLCLNLGFSAGGGITDNIAINGFYRLSYSNTNFGKDSFDEEVVMNKHRYGFVLTIYEEAFKKAVDNNSFDYFYFTIRVGMEQSNLKFKLCKLEQAGEETWETKANYYEKEYKSGPKFYAALELNLFYIEDGCDFLKLW